MNALPFTLFAYGEQHVSSVIAGLWNGTTPLMTLIAVLLLLPEERPNCRRIAGVAGGFAGLVVLLGPWQGVGGGKLLGDRKSTRLNSSHQSTYRMPSSA